MFQPTVQRLLDVTRTVLDLAIELMAVKTRWSDVAGEMANYVRDHGFSVVENFVGHGIGREMHEEPQVPNFVSSQSAAQPRFSAGDGPGDCRRADGEHWHEENQDAFRSLDASHERWQSTAPISSTPWR